MKTLLIGLLALGSISAFGIDCDSSVKQLKLFIDIKQTSLHSKVWGIVVQNDQWIQDHVEGLREIDGPVGNAYCFDEPYLPEFNEQVLKFKTDREEIHRKLEENEDRLDRIMYNLTKYCTGKIPDEEM